MPPALLGAALVLLCASVGRDGAPLSRPPDDGAADAARPGEPAAYRSDGKTIRVEVFRPPAKGRVPAILLLYGGHGLEDPARRAEYRQRSHVLARRGYVILLIRYLDRTGAADADGEASYGLWMATIRDGITYAQRRRDVAKERIGLVGASLGGALALSVGSVDGRVRAVVDYFGGLPAGLERHIRGMPPVLILQGGADAQEGVDAAKRLERLLRDAGVPCEMRLYPDQGHGFTGTDAEDAARRMAAFLDRYLRPEPAAPRPAAR